MNTYDVTNVEKNYDKEGKFFINVPILLPPYVIKHIVGKNAQNFKLMSNNFEIDYMWYNSYRRMITLWGDQTKLIAAYNGVKEVVEENTKKYLRTPYKLTNFVHNIDIYVNISLDGWIDKKNVKHLIGKSGSFFKEVTKKCSISFIWYDDKNHSLQLWGHDEGNKNAVSMINNKLLDLEHIDSYNFDSKRQKTTYMDKSIDTSLKLNI